MDTGPIDHRRDPICRCLHVTTGLWAWPRVSRMHCGLSRLGGGECREAGLLEGDQAAGELE